MRGTRLYFTATKSGLHALDLEGHISGGRRSADGGELSAPTVVMALPAGVVGAGGTYVVDASSGAALQFFSPGHGVTPEPISDGRQVYVLSNGGYLYALALNKL